MAPFVWLTLPAILLAIQWTVWTYRRRRHVYPPGPRGLPVIGNLIDMPRGQAWLGYRELARKYGDMTFLQVFGRPILVLNSAKAIHDLLDTRSASSSGRARTAMLNDLMGFDHGLFSLMDYGDEWRNHRRVFRQHFNPSALTQYRPIIQHQLGRFLTFLLDSPDKFHKHCETFVGSIILHIAYGYPTLVDDDPFIADGADVLKAFRIAGLPGSFLVDVFPILKYLPSRFPGAGFKRWAAHYRAKETSARRECFRYAADAMNGGSQTINVASQLISQFSTDNASEREEQERVARNVTFIAYIAGLDTSHAMATVFILAMAMYPEAQREAQKEVDSIIGLGRLPTIEDQEETVYIRALILELFRWHQVTPLVIPHSTTNDIYYEGYTIPKGTIVMGNAWAVLHDPEVFDSPMEFIPERYIKDGKINTDLPDPAKLVFGFGRRSCPGRHLGLEMLYMMIVSTLLLFDILPPEDEYGNPKEMEATFNDGITYQVENFDCIIRPRSAEAEAFIRRFHSVEAPVL